MTPRRYRRLREELGSPVFDPAGGSARLSAVRQQSAQGISGEPKSSQTFGLLEVVLVDLDRAELLLLLHADSVDDHQRDELGATWETRRP